MSAEHSKGFAYVSPAVLRARHDALPHSGSPTSVAAARKATPTAAVQRQAVIEALATGGKTDAEIRTATGLEGDSERPRRWQLCRDGLVRDSGRERNGMIVWELVPE